MAEGLLTDDLRALIGKPWPPVVFEVERTGIRMWARAVGFEDLVYHDERTAQRARLRGVASARLDLSDSRAPALAIRNQDHPFAGCIRI